MEAKFIQTKDLYDGNEYPNMPSLDYLGGDEMLTTKNKVEVDLGLVDEIVKKYGFEYCFITDTFCCYGERGTYRTDFVLYHKTDLDSDALKGVFYEGRSRETEKRIDIARRLHDCAHELDERTRLVFDAGWAGNVGIFGGHDVGAMTYMGGCMVEDWGYIENKWPSCIYDSARQLEKGVYLIMASNSLKTIC